MNLPRRCAILGSPVAHSLSPTLHRAAYSVLGLDWGYERHEVGVADLNGFLSALGPEWRGLSLTMPLKNEIARHLATIDETSALTGATNTVLIDEGRFYGFNTDVDGLVEALHDAGNNQVDVVDILGAGATAASALVAAKHLGADAVRVHTRTPARAQPLIELGTKLDLEVTVGKLQNLSGETKLVIATLPGGTELDPEVVKEAAASALLFDVAYAPWPSQLSEVWQEAGGTAVSGIGMLVHQALLQIRIFVSGDPQTPLSNESAVLTAMAESVGYLPKRR